MAEGITSIVIFGATGDLARRKLVPALCNLYQKGRTSQNLNIVGVARSSYSDDQFREFVWKGMEELGVSIIPYDSWKALARCIHFVCGDVNEVDSYSGLKERLEALEGDQRPADRLFYLSISPALYQTTIRNLGTSGLGQQDTGWRRVVIEKPFGMDLVSAQALNREVHQVFGEEQVFRIDHYLGKETVQNLLVFRFANTIFEPIWNRNYVDNVQITVSEDLAVGDRAGYYDQSGVVRDMIQNHLLQLLTMVAMEPPSAMDADSLRNKKVEVLKAIRRWTPEQAVRHAVRGQYPGYLNENGVALGSATPTYAALRLYVDNWRWQGVPFYLRSAKAMAQKISEVNIQFQCPPHLLFSPSPDTCLSPNILSLCLQPDEGAHLKFEAKMPDQGMAMRSVDMEFHYQKAFSSQEIPDAYERLLHDALEGDATLFIRSDHVEEAWRIVDALLRAWEDPKASPVHIYEPGS